MDNLILELSLYLALLNFWNIIKNFIIYFHFIIILFAFIYVVLQYNIDYIQLSKWPIIQAYELLHMYIFKLAYLTSLYSGIISKKD